MFTALLRPFPTRTTECISSLGYASAAGILRPRQINREASEITTRTYVKGMHSYFAKERIFARRIHKTEITRDYLDYSRTVIAELAKKFYLYLPNIDIL